MTARDPVERWTDRRLLSDDAGYTMACGTSMLLQGDLAALEARIEEEGRLFQETMQSAEAREAFTAFFEKRAPVFRRG